MNAEDLIKAYYQKKASGGFIGENAIQSKQLIHQSKKYTGGCNVECEGSGVKRTNPWIQHVKQYHSEHPNLTYKEAMSQAKETYVKGAALDPYSQGFESAAKIAEVAAPLVSQGMQNTKERYQQTGKFKQRTLMNKANTFNKLKNRMKKGNFPQMTDNELNDYIDREFSKI